MTEPTPTAELIAEARRYVDGEVGGRLAMDIITRLADAADQLSLIVAKSARSIAWREEDRAALQIVLSALQAEEARAKKTAWRLIAEAPRDGTKIAVWDEDGITTAHWCPCQDSWTEVPYNNDERRDFSHWRPLDPPTETD